MKLVPGQQLPFVVFLVAWLAAAIPSALAQNLVVNGDFSRGGDPPAGWAKEREAAGKGTMRVVGNMLEMAPNASNTTPSPVRLCRRIAAWPPSGFASH